MMLVRYAAASVACLTADWEFGNGGDLALGDMSEENGDIPGTSIGEPGHPEGTHRYGHDMDIGYYQQNTPDNRLRPICVHTIGGADQYHCTEAPVYLDVWRTALVLGLMHASPQLRVIGVDGQAGLAVASALVELCDAGWLDNDACVPRLRKLAYEPTDEGRGWYRFHHHHFHISLGDRASAGLPDLRMPVQNDTIDPYGDLLHYKIDPRLRTVEAPICE